MALDGGSPQTSAYGPIVPRGMSPVGQGGMTYLMANVSYGVPVTIAAPATTVQIPYTMVQPPQQVVLGMPPPVAAAAVQGALPVTTSSPAMTS